MGAVTGEGSGSGVEEVCSLYSEMGSSAACVFACVEEDLT